MVVGVMINGQNPHETIPQSPSVRGITIVSPLYDADGSELYDCAKFAAADTVEELTMVAQRNPQIEKAAVKLRELSADERARDMFERREKGQRDLAMFADDAMRKKQFKIARKDDKAQQTNR